MAKIKKKAMVVFSGGQDSTTCLLWALDKFEEVEGVGFDYGQKHKVEIRCARAICSKLKVPYKVINLSFLDDISVSNLVSSSEGNVSEAHSLNASLPSSFVPYRNMIFLTLASAYSLKQGASELVTGVNATDYSGYPDCRPEFIASLAKTLGKATDSKAMEVTIHTPLMKVTKAETFEMAKKLNGLEMIVEMTHTCYKGDHKTRHPWGFGCSDCPSCALRKKGFEEFEAGVHLKSKAKPKTEKSVVKKTTAKSVAKKTTKKS